MPAKSTKTQAFRSEADEADWYATAGGRRQTALEFGRALRNGSLASSPGASVPKTDPAVLQQLMAQAKENATRAISIRIPVADLELARRIAEETGVGYQTVLKQAIRDGLRRVG